MEKPKGMDRGTRTFILLTAFMNLAGVGLIIPVSPFIVAEYVNPANLALINSLLFTSYSLAQFLAVPTLGALSDRYGRRPILLVSLLGSAVGYLMFGIGGSLAMLFAGRIIDGITGGNIAIIYAYAADITTPQERTRFYGVIGAVSGLAFVVGPTIGGLLYAVTRVYEAPLFAAALLYVFNTAYGYYVMPESLSLDRRSNIQLAKLNPFTQLREAFTLAQTRLLLFSIFLWATAFAVLQSNLSLLAQDKLGAGPDAISALLALIGVIGIVVQGFLVRKLLPTIGEGRMALAGFLAIAIGMAGIGTVGITASLPVLIASVFVFALGNGLVLPSVNGLLSQSVGNREQGKIQGGNQSVQALARVVGPVFGGWAYGTFSASLPFFAAAVMAMCGLVLASMALPILAQAKRKRDEAAAVSGATGQ